MMIINEMHEQSAPSVSANTHNNVVNASLAAELATYKEQVELYERRDKFELTEREQNIEEQLRIVITNRNIKEEILKKELHSVKMQLSSTINHNKPMVEEVTSLKKDFQQKENKYLEEFLDMKALKKIHEIIKTNHVPAIMHNSKDTLEIAEITRKKMNEKIKDPEYVKKKALIKEIKEMKEVFEELEDEVDQNVVNSKYDEIERKNLLRANDNLIVDCLSKEVFYIATNFELTVSRFTIMHDAHTVVQACCLELEVELSKLNDKIQQDDNNELVKRFSNIEIILWYLDLGCSKHMTGNRSRIKNLMKRFIGTVRFGNDHFRAIMGYGDYVIGDSVISRVYYVEGLRHNIFFVRQFCDSHLEVAFRKHSWYVCDIDGVELIKCLCGSNLYTISVEDMLKSSPICLLSKAFKNKSWLWHRPLNHLNFGTINDLAREDLVRGLPRLKFEKDHLCSACQLEKRKKHTHKPKSKNTIIDVLHTLHMDLCGPMRVQSINGKRYILVIVDDFSRFTWVKFLRSKAKMPEFVTKFLTQIQVGLNKTVRFIRTDNSTASMFLWAEAVSTACYTQNRPLIHTRHHKTPYELVYDKKHDLTFFRVFGALCYPTNDNKDLGKLQPTTDIGIFIGYAPSRKGYRIYNRRTRRIMETIHVQFDELVQPMAPVQLSTGPAPTFLTPG
ncbi:retrovirus-related pol polyprotein from transposon TNT 1-94 [Tanacetum coccineum]